MATAASKRDPPSTGAKNSTLRKTQKEKEIDAIYNGRPVNLTAPPIEIYHPVFAKFRHEISLPIDKSSFTAEELGMAMELVTTSLAFYGARHYFTGLLQGRLLHWPSTRTKMPE